MSQDNIQFIEHLANIPEVTEHIFYGMALGCTLIQDLVEAGSFDLKNAIY
jgi:hypothetical protein